MLSSVVFFRNSCHVHQATLAYCLGPEACRFGDIMGLLPAATRHACAVSVEETVSISGAEINTVMQKVKAKDEYGLRKRLFTINGTLKAPCGAALKAVRCSICATFHSHPPHTCIVPARDGDWCLGTAQLCDALAAGPICQQWMRRVCFHTEDCVAQSDFGQLFHKDKFSVAFGMLIHGPEYNPHALVTLGFTLP